MSAAALGRFEGESWTARFRQGGQNFGKESGRTSYRQSPIVRCRATDAAWVQVSETPRGRGRPVDSVAADRLQNPNNSRYGLGISPLSASRDSIGM